MAAAVSFRWLEILEKEFDKAFVDLDLLLGEVDPDQCELTYDGRQKMTALSAAFAQLCHKAQTIFQTNAKLEVIGFDSNRIVTIAFGSVILAISLSIDFWQYKVEVNSTVSGLQQFRITIRKTYFFSRMIKYFDILTIQSNFLINLISCWRSKLD